MIDSTFLGWSLVAGVKELKCLVMEGESYLSLATLFN